MKAILLALALATVQSNSLNFMTLESTQPTESCSDKVSYLAMTFHEMEMQIRYGEYSLLRGTIDRLIAQLTDIKVNCFKTSELFSFAKNTIQGLFNTGDQRECIIHHLKDFGHELGEAIKHLFHGDFDGAKLHLQTAQKILQDIKNC